jgi:hypothetical protein
MRERQPSGRGAGRPRARVQGATLAAQTSATDRRAATPGPAPALPNERDESVGAVAAAPDPVVQQAAHDIAAGLVDTDLRGSAGVDAERRDALVRRGTR